jgi:hypothetical protein
MMYLIFFLLNVEEVYIPKCLDNTRARNSSGVRPNFVTRITNYLLRVYADGDSGGGSRISHNKIAECIRAYAGARKYVVDNDQEIRNLGG